VPTGATGFQANFFGPGGQTARLMLYGLLSIVLMAIDQRGHYIPRLRDTVGDAAEPLYHFVDWPVRTVESLGSQFESREELRNKNESLRAALLAQEADLQRLDTLVEENRRLRALLEGSETLMFETQFAELVRVDLDPFSHRVMIDKGSADGVEVGQAVIDSEGVMGQVEDVQLHMSRVRLISDPNHAIPVQVNRTGLRAVAFGTGETGELVLESIPLEADVREGDVLVTSGLGDRFPGGYPVATISSVIREEGHTFADVTAHPLAALDRGREVLLIVPQFTKEAFIGPPDAAGNEDSQP
jgi:rod shape-determining protein MreC